MSNDDKASDAQIKRLYAVLYSLGIDPNDFRKDKNIASFAKLTRKQVSAWITELEQQEKKAASPPSRGEHETATREGAKARLRECIRDAVDIVNNEPNLNKVGTDTRAYNITTIAIALFNEAED